MRRRTNHVLAVFGFRGDQRLRWHFIRSSTQAPPTGMSAPSAPLTSASNRRPSTSSFHPISTGANQPFGRQACRLRSRSIAPAKAPKRMRAPPDITDLSTSALRPASPDSRHQPVIEAIHGRDRTRAVLSPHDLPTLCLERLSMELFKDTRFDFLRRKWWFILPSLVLTLAGVASLFLKGGPQYSIDFRAEP